MRRELAAQEGERKKFKAVFSRIGKKVNYKGYSEETILLSSLVDLDTNKIVTDHVWFSCSQGFIKASLSLGDTVEFVARVKKYRKGYVNKKFMINNKENDFKLSNPTKIKKVLSTPGGAVK